MTESNVGPVRYSSVSSIKQRRRNSDLVSSSVVCVITRTAARPFAIAFRKAGIYFLLCRLKRIFLTFCSTSKLSESIENAWSPDGSHIYYGVKTEPRTFMNFVQRCCFLTSSLLV
jgi:hypothetical protein